MPAKVLDLYSADNASEQIEKFIFGDISTICSNSTFIYVQSHTCQVYLFPSIIDVRLG